MSHRLAGVDAGGTFTVQGRWRVLGMPGLAAPALDEPPARTHRPAIDGARP